MKYNDGININQGRGERERAEKRIEIPSCITYDGPTPARCSESPSHADIPISPCISISFFHGATPRQKNSPREEIGSSSSARGCNTLGQPGVSSATDGGLAIRLNLFYGTQHSADTLDRQPPRWGQRARHGQGRSAGSARARVQMYRVIHYWYTIKMVPYQRRKIDCHRIKMLYLKKYIDSSLIFQTISIIFYCFLNII